MSGAHPNPLACPQCRQVDMVQKVSAIVDAGTFTGSYTVSSSDPFFKDFLAPGFVIALIMEPLLIGINIRRTSRRRARITAAMLAWQRADRLWQQLYYCARCDGVFIPGGRSPLIPAAQMRQFLYSMTSGHAPRP